VHRTITEPISIIENILEIAIIAPHPSQLSRLYTPLSNVDIFFSFEELTSAVANEFCVLFVAHSVDCLFDCPPEFFSFVGLFSTHRGIISKNSCQIIPPAGPTVGAK